MYRTKFMFLVNLSYVRLPIGPTKEPRREENYFFIVLSQQDRLTKVHADAFHIKFDETVASS